MVSKVSYSVGGGEEILQAVVFRVGKQGAGALDGGACQARGLGAGIEQEEALVEGGQHRVGGGVMREREGDEKNQVNFFLTP